MKTRKQLLIFLMLLMCATLLMAASCGEKPHAPCPVCDEWPCVCPDGFLVEITTAQELAEIAKLVNEGKLEEHYTGNPNGKVYIKMMNDIDLSGYASGKGWTPIGTYVYENPDEVNRWDSNTYYIGDEFYLNDEASLEFAFRSVFDGNNKTITGLTINDPGMKGAGLFGAVYGGTVKNLTVTGASVKGDWIVGGVVGFLFSVSNKDKSVLSKIENCSFSGTVNGKDYVGGVVGRVAARMATQTDYIHIDECKFAAGTVSGTDKIGGVAAYLYGSNIKNSSSAGAVNGKDYVGGVTGDAAGASSVTGCYATGDVSATGKNVGGVAGRIVGSPMESSYSTGAVSGQENVGGVVGWIYSCNVKNCYATGDVSATGKNVGGLAGFVDSGDIKHSASVKNCYATAKVSGQENVGGVAGNVQNSDVENCWAAGEVKGTGGNVGGLAGQLIYDSILRNCAALNSKVTGAGTIGRVTGKYDVYTTLSNNAAFSGMEIAITPVDNLRGPDGLGMGVNAIRGNGSLAERFTASGGWTTVNGKLPGFGAAVDMPEHL